MKVKIFFLGLLTCIGVNSSGQDKSLSEIQKQFQDYAVNNLQEKIFIHTDKNLYVAGETLWFSIYSVDGTFHRPLTISKIAYIEILNREKKTVARTKVKLMEGRGHGSLVLRGLSTDAYSLRAYTRWMRNYDADFFFEKKITVVNPNEQFVGENQMAEAADAPDIRFFPEGGNLVYSLESTIGFKVAGSDGRGLQCNGVLLNQNQEIIATFKTLKFGIGRFAFTPVRGQKYTVRMIVNDKVFTAALPEVLNEGYVMKVADTGQSLSVSVRYAGTNDAKKVFLLAHSRQFQKTALEAALKDGLAEFTLPKSKIGDGITHLTLFDEDKVPTCERLFFKKPENILEIETSVSSRIASPRDMVTVKISTFDNRRIIPAHLSLSVLMVDSLQKVEQDRIISNLLLTSDLVGTIESPDYYINSSDTIASVAADNLMLTHGWRRFKWTDVLKYQTHHKRFEPEYEGVIVEGKLVSKNTELRKGNIPLLLSFPANSRLYTAKTDNSGDFEFYAKEVYGTPELVITPLDNLVQSDVQIQDPFDNRVTKRSISSHRSSNTHADLLREKSIHALVMQQATIFKTKADASSDTVPQYGQPDATYRLSDYVLFPTLEEVMREYVREVFVKKKDKELQLFVLQQDADALFPKEPLVLIDGVPVSDTDQLIRGSAKNIEKIEVLTKKFMQGPLVFDGVISLETYSHDLTGFEIDSGSFVLRYEGLQYDKEFYSPRYESVADRTNRRPDFRNVLHWEPEINTGTDGTAEIKFFTGDATGRFMGVLQGITDDGSPGTHTFFFDVRENPR